jgi:ABC-2 type transport system ATP-binding protein
MKQKLLIIQAMQENPDLLIMDEPSEGLDPINKSTLYDYVKKFKGMGKTVFFSSHYLAEVEKICDRVGLVRDGELIAEESIESLKKKMVRKMQIFFAEKYDILDFQSMGTTIAEHDKNKLVLNVTGDLNSLLIKISKYKINNLIFPEPSLEDTFLTYYS